MKFFKASIIILVITLIFTKSIDILVGYFLLSKEQRNEILNKNKIEVRNIILKEHHPNQNTLLSAPEKYTKKINKLHNKIFRFRTDDNGYIIGPKHDSNSENVDFIFFGGSTTECIFVEENKRFPYLLTKILQRSDGTLINSLNAGVSGNHSMHSLLNLLGKGIIEKPKFVILMHAANDMGTLLNTSSYWNAPFKKKIIRTTENLTFKSYLKGLIFETSKIIKNIFLPNFWIFSRDSIFNFLRSEEDDFVNFRKNQITFENLENILNSDFRSALTSFILVSRSWNIEPILMTQFNNYNKENLISPDSNLSSKELFDLYIYTNQIVREVAKVNNVQLIDLEKKIKGESLFLDKIHLNSYGSILVANEIAKEISVTFSELYKIKP